MERIQTYTITNQSITSPFLLCTYTANDNRNLTFELYLSAIAGNGVYKFCLTKQSSGSGLFYQSPTSFATVPSGVTTAFLPTISIPVVNGDVVKVYVEGQSFDTSVSGKVEVYDSANEYDSILDVAVSTRLASASYTTPPTSASIADAVWDEILTGATHNINTSAGKRLRQLASNIIYMGTVVSATTNTITLDAGADASNGAYDPSAIDIVSGTGTGQSRMVLQYDGASRTCTVDRDWKILPVAGDEFMITVNTGREHVNEGLAQGGTINTITLNANASPFDNTYVGQVVFIRSGTGADQACRITAYNGTTKVATVAKDWHTVPDTTSAYVMLPTSILDLQSYANMISTTVWNNATRTLTSYGTLVSDIWSYVTRTITSGGITAQQVWEYATRTLTSSGGALTAAEVWSYVKRSLTPTYNQQYFDSTDVTATRGDTFSREFGTLDLENYDNVYFTIKKNYKDIDSLSTIQVSSSEGLLYLNGVEPLSSIGASIIVDKPNNKITVEIDAEIMVQVDWLSSNYVYDVEIIKTTGEVSTPVSGIFAIVRDVTRAIT